MTPKLLSELISAALVPLFFASLFWYAGYRFIKAIFDAK